MGRATIPVDLFNPGQVFGCLGLVEAALVLTGHAMGGFAVDGVDATFTVADGAEGDPVARILAFLGDAEVVSRAPPGDGDLGTEKWSVDTERAPSGSAFPYPAPPSPATLPAVLRHGPHELTLESWGDATRRDNVKFWAGAGGYPGVGLLRDALDLARPHLAGASTDPFRVTAPQSSSFRFDWRRDYVPLGIGFSVNAHGKLTMAGFPLVEVLAAIGMSHARPQRPERRNKLLYQYAVPLAPLLHPALLRAALGGAPLPFPTRTFRMTLDWPGQEGQARCITDVTEEI